MRRGLVPSNIAQDDALEVRDAVPTQTLRSLGIEPYRTEFPK